MLTPSAGLMVYVATRPVDFRKGADGLALLAKETLGHDPMKGVAVVFRAKRVDRVKIVAGDARRIARELRAGADGNEFAEQVKAFAQIINEPATAGTVQDGAVA